MAIKNIGEDHSTRYYRWVLWLFFLGSIRKSFEAIFHSKSLGRSFVTRLD